MISWSATRAESINFLFLPVATGCSTYSGSAVSFYKFSPAFLFFCFCIPNFNWPLRFSVLLLVLFGFYVCFLGLSISDCSSIIIHRQNGHLQATLDTAKFRNITDNSFPVHTLWRFFLWHCQIVVGIRGDGSIAACVWSIQRLEGINLKSHLDQEA